MADELQRELTFEDILSTSEEETKESGEEKPVKKPEKNPKKKSGKRKKGTARALDKIVKAIAFLVALFVLLLFGAGAFIIYKMDKSFSMIALCVLIAGISFSLITLFMIYAIGHIITQNNEILKRL